MNFWPVPGYSQTAGTVYKSFKQVTLVRRIFFIRQFHPGIGFVWHRLHAFKIELFLSFPAGPIKIKQLLLFGK